MALRFLGILREPIYSPGKVDADRAILEATASGLGEHGEARIIDSVARLPHHADADVVFTMAQGPDALYTMRRWHQHGVRVINTADAIERCHRHRMITAFTEAAVPQPPSAVLSTATAPSFPAWLTDGAWIKRGDVHATEADDVVRAHDRTEAMQALESFARRGIETVVLQRHVPGSIFKFYAVRGVFFAAFPAQEGCAEPEPATIAAMRALGERGAAALGLEVFGGDCVQQPNAELQLIDMNDWPSYGRCRMSAARAIAQYIATSARQ